jgi:serine/threonine protein kinase, bacterial
MTKKLPYLGATLCALILLCAARPAAAGPYGALATSPEADFGFSYNYDDEDSAQDRALSECQKHSSNCTIKGTFENTCVSIAKASNGAMGWAWGRSKRDDDRVAMSECRKNRGGDCELARRFCTGDP